MNIEQLGASDGKISRTVSETRQLWSNDHYLPWHALKTSQHGTIITFYHTRHKLFVKAACNAKQF